MADFRYNDEVVIPNMDRVMKVEGVNRHTMSASAIEEILKIFGVENATDPEDVRAVRNSVVRYLHNKIKSECLDPETDYWKQDDDSFKKLMNYNMWMSAITAALDHKMFSLDPRSV